MDSHKKLCDVSSLNTGGPESHLQSELEIIIDHKIERKSEINPFPPDIFGGVFPMNSISCGFKAKNYLRLSFHRSTAAEMPAKIPL